MKNSEFKFRHANELAGAFVLGAVFLFIMGIVFVGKSQEWFEPRITLHIVFDSPEGSFGLQEGAQVLVRNTLAGRVGPMEPNEEGLITTTLEIKERFQPFITEDSVAKVKKKFGVAGDAFVEMVRGAGAVVRDGAEVEAIKDEELLDTAQRVLTEVQDGVLPVLNHFETIISNVANVTISLDHGEGIAGSIISDPQLRDHVGGVVSNLNAFAMRAQTLAGAATGLMSNEIAMVADKAIEVQTELGTTLSETRKVIRALQKHWLIRKYVEEDEDTLPVVAGLFVWSGRGPAAEVLQSAMTSARLADNPKAIAQAAVNLAVYALDADQVEVAAELVNESKLAGRRTGELLPAVMLLEAELLRREGEYEAAQMVIAELQRQLSYRQRSLRAQAYLMQATLAADTGDVNGATEAYDDARKQVKRLDDDSLLESAVAGMRARLALMDGDLQASAAAYLDQASKLSQLEAYYAMAMALHRAGDCFSNAESHSSAAEAYLRATESFLSQGNSAKARLIIDRANAESLASGDPMLITQAKALTRRFNTLHQ